MVPRAMDKNICLRQTCTRIVAAIPAISGSPCKPSKNLTSFRQYTTSIPKTARGNTFPRYRMYLGVAFPAENTRNGSARVRAVTIARMAMVAIRSSTVMGCLELLFENGQ